MGRPIKALIISEPYLVFAVICPKSKQAGKLKGFTYSEDLPEEERLEFPVEIFNAPLIEKGVVIVRVLILGSNQHVLITCENEDGSSDSLLDHSFTDRFVQELNSEGRYSVLRDYLYNVDRLDPANKPTVHIEKCLSLRDEAFFTVSFGRPAHAWQDLLFYNTDGSTIDAERYRFNTIYDEECAEPLNLWKIDKPTTNDVIVINKAATEGAECGFISDVQNKIDPAPSDILCPYNDDTYTGRIEAESPDIGWNGTDQNPLFSIIVPLFNTPDHFFNEMVDSVLAQTYTNFELILVNASPKNKELGNLVHEREAADSRVRVVALTENKGITENTNAGIENAQGEFLCFLDHDDILTQDALMFYAQALRNDSSIDLLYCDEDMLENGRYCKVLYKPDFNLDLLRSKNYVIHFLAIRKTIFDQMPRPTAELDGAQDYNATFFAAEKARKICHIPQVLYHWRIHDQSTAVSSDAKPYAENAGKVAIQRHLDRVTPGATAILTEITNNYAIRYPLPQPHLLSVIRVGNPSESLMPQNIDFEVVGAESFTAEALNEAASRAKGDYLLFLNETDRICTPYIFYDLIGLCARPDVGAVGMKVIDYSGTVKVSGYAKPNGNLLPLFQGYFAQTVGYLCLAQVLQDVSAVSIHGLLTSKALFKELGGLENDEYDMGIPYCNRATEAGRLVVQEPSALLMDYSDFNPKPLISNLPNEADPYFNENLDCTNPCFVLKEAAKQ